MANGCVVPRERGEARKKGCGKTRLEENQTKERREQHRTNAQKMRFGRLRSLFCLSPIPTKANTNKNQSPLTASEKPSFPGRAVICLRKKKWRPNQIAAATKTKSSDLFGTCRNGLAKSKRAQEESLTQPLIHRMTPYILASNSTSQCSHILQLVPKPIHSTDDA